MFAEAARLAVAVRSLACARMDARLMARTFDFFRRRIPSICRRQLGSVAVTNSAPEASALEAFASPMAAAIIGNFAEKVPPKPQQSSL